DGLSALPLVVHLLGLLPEGGLGCTLFPCSALFRSSAEMRASASFQPDDSGERASTWVDLDTSFPTGKEVSGSTHVLARSPLSSGDRESTRLNSSHDQNPYAVFCLKQKNARVRLPAP